MHTLAQSRAATAHTLLVAVLLSLSACGGGGGSSSIDGSNMTTNPQVAAVAAVVSKNGNKNPSVNTPMISVQPVTVVNTTTEGDQVFRNLSPLDNSGYTVAWLSGSDKVFTQRFDSAGMKTGAETQLQLNIEGVSESLRANAIGRSSVAVLRDGSVVVSYSLTRPANLSGTGVLSYKNGVYVQRFNANGMLVMSETEIFSQTFVPNYRSPGLDLVRSIALADGGFVVGWEQKYPSSVTIRNTFSVRRYGSSGQAIGPAVPVGTPMSPGADAETYALMPDATGGYVVSTFQKNEDYTPFSTLTYFDTTNTPQSISLPNGTTDARLLPLEGGRFVLFGQGPLGAYRQFLDLLGAPVGPQTPIPGLPGTTLELIDGSYVTFTSSASAISAQRFDSEGVTIGESVLISTQGAAFSAAAISEGGFAGAWTGSSALSGTDVFAQRFLIALDPVESGIKAKRKACKESARSQGLKGQARKQFIDACQQS